MSARTLEDQVSSLLSRTIAEDKQVGSPRPDLEASAIFDSIALSLLLKPRGALYLAFLARNALTTVVQAELTLLDTLTQDIDDLGNPSYKITGAPIIRRAQVALMNLEGLPRINSSSVSLSLFNTTVSEFLEKHLSKNVRQAGNPNLARPSAEAAQDLPGTFESLSSKHEDLLDRLYALASSIENFEAAPFGAIIGTTTVARARADLDAIASIVEGSGSAEHARDIAVRLIGSRSTINTVAAPTKWGDTLLPATATGRTAKVKATQTGTVAHPFTLPPTPVLAISDGLTTLAFGFFQENTATLVGASASYPVTIPTGYYLFLTYTIGGVSTAVKIPMTGTFSNAVGVAQNINAAGVPGLVAQPFGSDSSRIMLSMSGASLIAINSVYVLSQAEATALGVTITSSITLSDSASSYIGLADGAVGDQTLLEDVVVDAINQLFPFVDASSTAGGKIVITTKKDDLGISLRVFGNVAPVLGFDGLVHPATVLSFTLDDVSDHTELLQAEDILTLPDGTESVIKSVDETSVTFKEATKTFGGSVSARSVLVSGYISFITALKSFLVSWGETPYVSDLTVVDRAIAPLAASQSPAQRNEALDAVDALRKVITSLLNVLTDASTMLPARAALSERKLVEGLISTLAERNYGRAIDLLLKGDLQALLEMDDSTASYGGNFMKASSALARSSIRMTDSTESDSPSSLSVGLR